MKDQLRRLTSQYKSPVLLFYVLAVVVMTAQFIITTYKLAEDPSFSRPLLRELLMKHLSDTLILTSFYWLLPSRGKRWLWLMIVIVTVWCFAQITYNETYQDVMPFSSWLYVSNVGDVLVDSILGTITRQAVWVVVIPLLLLVVWLLLLRKRVKHDDAFLHHRWLMWAFALMLALAFQFSIMVMDNLRGKQSLKEYFLIKYCNTVNFKTKVYPISNGYVPFVVYSVVKACDGVGEQDRNHAKQFLEKELPYYTDNCYCVVPSRNLVLLMVESLNAWVVDLKIDGREVCPVLNSLIADTSSISCTLMMAQVKNGRSSDGMFIYNTGLLPLASGSVAMDYGDNEYPSLARALKAVNKNYHAMEITVDHAGMWNVENTARSYGFDSLHLQDCFREKYLKSGQSIDKALLEYASGEIAVARHPFYAMIFTGTTHIPYDKLEKIQPTWISQSKSYTVNVRNYLEKVAFFDRQLGEFVDRLKRDGAYDNTVLVIASDHSDFVDTSPEGRPSISQRGIETLFVIVNSGLPGRHIQGPVGQVDLYPTILDIMGANAYWWKGLGYSLVRHDVSSAALSAGESAGDTKSPLFIHQRDAWDVSTTVIKTNWWKQ